MKTFVDRMLAALDDMVEVMDDLLDASEIQHDPGAMERFARQTGFLVPGMPDSVWKKANAEQQRLQRFFLEKWEPWCEQLTLLFSGDTKTKQKGLAKAVKGVDLWVHRNSVDHTIPATIDQAKVVFRKKIEPLQVSLQALRTTDLVVNIVPDTNILLQHPDITSYSIALGTAAYTVWLVPPVLAELDSHKVNHRNPDVREKAMKFTSRLKGWRNQGSLVSGVKVAGAVYVRAEGKEPEFEKTLSWLHEEHADDRILACTLELQRRYPSTFVVLASRDTNMLTKADAALVPTVDIE